MSTCHGTDPPGSPRTTKSKVLETGAAAVQNFTPVKQICAHLNAFHVYADDPSRCVEANHYCSHITEDIRQCLLYDSPNANARLIGLEYMISPRLFRTLPEEEKHLWHTHEYEVKSGMLVMPAPATMPDIAWDTAETSEMYDVAPLYGKTYHFWQVDRGDALPLGPPVLMGSFVSEETVKAAKKGGLDELVKDRDERFGIDTRKKAELRREIPDVDKDPAADCTWPKS